MCAQTLGRGKIAGNPQKITIPEEEEEETEAEGQGETQEAQTLTVEDYEEMNRALINIGNTVNRSIVEIRQKGAVKSRMRNRRYPVQQEYSLKIMGQNFLFWEAAEY